jgi:uncharacterized protein (DUF924 family)
MTPRVVLDFWFGTPPAGTTDALRRAWFVKDPAFDAAVASRFGSLIEQALRGELEHWSATPGASLAEIVVLDQFTRNAFRDTPRAFAGDARALALARALVGSQRDLELSLDQRAFCYMPFEHAESIDMQDQAVRLFSGLTREQPRFADMLDYAERHRDVIRRFGRFPHRNAILGRASSPEEQAYLAEPGAGF